MNRPVRVSAVDDHEFLLRGLVAFMTDEPDLEPVAVATTVDALLERGTPADVVLLDLHLGDGSDPADNVRRLAETGAAVLLFTTEHRPGRIQPVLAAGAMGLVLKEDPAERVADAVREAARGEFVISSELALEIVEEPAGTIPLSPREREVLELLARGLPWDAVARVLGIQADTARTHLRRVAAKYAGRGVDIHNGPREVVYRAISDGHIDVDG